MSGTSAVGYNPNSYERFVEHLRGVDERIRERDPNFDRYEDQILGLTHVFDRGSQGIEVVADNYLDAGAFGGHERRLILETLKIKQQAIEAIKSGDHQKFEDALAMFGTRFLEHAEVDLSIQGIEKLDPNEVFFFAPNHSSWGDILVLFFALQQWKIGFLAKDELTQYKFLRKLFSDAMLLLQERFPLVKRDERDRLYPVVSALLDTYLRPDNQLSINIFSTENRVDHEFRDGRRVDGDIFKYRSNPFKAGLPVAALRLAQLGKPIRVVPVTINGTGAAWGKSFSLEPRTRIEVILGEPFDPTFLLGQDISFEEASRQFCQFIEDHWRKTYTGHLTAADYEGPRHKKGLSDFEKLKRKWGPYLLKAKETEAKVRELFGQERVKKEVLPSPP